MNDHAFALDRVGDDRGRLAFGRGGFSKRRLQRRDAVAVHLDGVPVEGAPFFRQRIERHDVVHEAVQLDAIVIDDGHQVVDVLVAAEHGRFPDLPFLDLAVAENDVAFAKDVHPAWPPAPCRSRWRALAERTGGSLERRDEAHIRMALINGAELPQRVQLILGRVTTFGHHAVEHRRRVALWTG